jgi:hypothetical protein
MISHENVTSGREAALIAQLLLYDSQVSLLPLPPSLITKDLSHLLQTYPALKRFKISM